MKCNSLKTFNYIKTTGVKHKKRRKTYERTYNPTDIATDEEANEVKCDCMIHSGGRQPLKQEGYMEMWWSD